MSTTYISRRQQIAVSMQPGVDIEDIKVNVD